MLWCGRPARTSWVESCGRDGRTTRSRGAATEKVIDRASNRGRELLTALLPETGGVGQSETAVAEMVDFPLALKLAGAGAGDEL